MEKNTLVWSILEADQNIDTTDVVRTNYVN